MGAGAIRKRRADAKARKRLENVPQGGMESLPEASNLGSESAAANFDNLPASPTTSVGPSVVTGECPAKEPSSTQILPQPATGIASRPATRTRTTRRAALPAHVLAVATPESTPPLAQAPVAIAKPTTIDLDGGPGHRPMMKRLMEMANIPLNVRGSV
jgi:hypothetical protein